MYSCFWFQKPIEKVLKMIITQLIGGIGNQLFQYAIARKIACGRNVPFKLDITGFNSYKLRQYQLGFFNINAEIASDEEIYRIKKYSENKIVENIYQKISRILPYSKKHYIKEQFFPYDPRIEKITDNVYLEGYWQSEKYFKSIASIIRSDITLKEEMIGKNRELKEKIIDDEHSVSIHIRRGDYVTNSLTHQIHGCCSLEYYYKGIQKINELLGNPNYYVFSDDIPWTKENLTINNPVTYIENEGPGKDYEELILMSLCRHHIIANSSFSWWGAWLGTNTDKITIAPSRWVNDPSRDMSDIIPENWIKINN
jgi:hypothetical protein